LHVKIIPKYPAYGALKRSGKKIGIPKRNDETIFTNSTFWARKIPNKKTWPRQREWEGRRCLNELMNFSCSNELANRVEMWYLHRGHELCFPSPFLLGGQDLSNQSCLFVHSESYSSRTFYLRSAAAATNETKWKKWIARGDRTGYSVEATRLLTYCHSNSNSAAGSDRGWEV